MAVIGVPQEVLDVKQRVEAQMIGETGIFGVGLSYDGDEWAVIIIRGPHGPHAAYLPTEVDGVKIIIASAEELRAREI